MQGTPCRGPEFESRLTFDLFTTYLQKRCSSWENYQTYLFLYLHNNFTNCSIVVLEKEAFFTLFPKYFYVYLWIPLRPQYWSRSYNYNKLEFTLSVDARMVFSQTVALQFLRRRCSIYILMLNFNPSWVTVLIPGSRF